MKNSKLLRALVALAVLLGLLAAGYAFLSSRDASLRQQKVARLLQDARDLRDFQDDASEAFVKLKAAAGLEPDSWEVLYELGVTSLALEKTRDAIGALDRAAELAPPSAAPRVSLKLGMAYRDRYVVTGERSDFRRATFAFESARPDRDLEPEALYHLGILALGLQRKKDLSEADLPQALEYFTELQSKYPDIEQREQVGKLIELIRSKS